MSAKIKASMHKRSHKNSKIMNKNADFGENSSSLKNSCYNNSFYYSKILAKFSLAMKNPNKIYDFYKQKKKAKERYLLKFKTLFPNLEIYNKQILYLFHS